MNRFLPLAAATAVALFLNPLARAHDQHAVDEMTSAARSFLATLTPEQKAKAQLPFTDDERKNWHYIPRPRKGLPFKEMGQGQRLLAQALFATGMSPRGFQKALNIMSLEDILAVMEKDKKGGAVRDPENYFFSIFGEPGKDDVWGWRVEGHHLSFNFTTAAGSVASMTPSFFGTNPGEVREGARQGLRVLSAEEDIGWELVRSLDEGQRKEAIVMAEAPKDVLNIPGRADGTKPEGLAQARMNPQQQEVLARLIHEYIDRHRADVVADTWATIELEDLGKVKFAWAGGTEAGQPHYYRVQGPTFVLEFDNTQNEANHVHALWRDLSHDFGGDPLLEHYKESHAQK